MEFSCFIHQMLQKTDAETMLMLWNDLRTDLVTYIGNFFYTFR